jgi:hypothetical protein
MTRKGATMPDQPLDFLSPDAAAAAAADTAARDTATIDRRARGAADSDDSGLLAAADREHLEREIAAIERASAALRRAEPELESWGRFAACDLAQATARLAFDRRAVALHRAGDARRRFRHLGAGGLAARGLSSPRRLGPNARVSDKYWTAAV